jgi:dienelactone hydrolase
LILQALVLFLRSFNRIGAMIRHLRTDDYGEGNGFFLAFGMVYLAAAVCVALIFMPPPRAPVPAGTFTEQTLRDESRGLDLPIRVYGAEGGAGPRPLLIVVPSVIGTADSLDSVCREFRKKGFFVVTGFHADAATPFSALFAFMAGTRLKAANQAGRALENTRLQDARFLVSAVVDRTARGDPVFAGADPERIVLVGYGTGAAGITLLAGSIDLGAVKAAIAVEGPVLSYYATEQGKAESVHIFSRVLERLVPDAVIGIGTVPATRIPLLFIVSDRAREPLFRDTRYAGILRVLRLSPVPAAVASVGGAGYFDFSELAVEYPLYSGLYRDAEGRRATVNRHIRESTTLAANFAALHLGSGLLRTDRVMADVKVELSGPWNSDGVKGILSP